MDLLLSFLFGFGCLLLLDRVEHNDAFLDELGHCGGVVDVGRGPVDI